MRARLTVEEAEDARALHSEHDVLGDGEDRHEHEVLMNHADPGGKRLAGDCGTSTGSPSRRIWPWSGLQQPVEDVHQRRLAGAVLAEQRVDLARLDGEVDAVVGDEAAKTLRDPTQLELQRDLPTGHGTFQGCAVTDTTLERASACLP